MAWAIYWFGVILAVYVGIMHVLRIVNKVERMGFAVRNFTWIGYYYKTSVSWYGRRVPNPKINGTIIRRPRYFWVIIKNVLIGPWFSRFFIIEKLITVIDELDYLSKMPNRLKEILNTIYEHDLPKDEMMELVEEINEIHYHGYYFVPQDIRTEEEKKKEEKENAIFKLGDVSIKKGNYGNVIIEYYGVESILDKGRKTISNNPKDNTVFLYDTDEYQVDGTSVKTRCIDFTDYEPESWRAENHYEFKPIEDGIVYESRIIEDGKQKYSGWKDEKIIREYIEEDIKKYKERAEWIDTDWWTRTAVLYTELNEEEFRKYIKASLEDAKCAILHLEDLCNKYGFTLEFDDELNHHIKELRGKVKFTKKVNEFNEEYQELLKRYGALCSKSMIKMLEEYLNKDK